MTIGVWDYQVRKQTEGAIYWIPDSRDVQLSNADINLSRVGESHLVPAKILPEALARKFNLSGYSGTGKCAFVHVFALLLDGPAYQ